MFDISKVLAKDETILWSSKQSQPVLLTLSCIALIFSMAVGYFLSQLGPLSCEVNGVPSTCHPAQYAKWVYLVSPILIAWWYFYNIIMTYYLTNKRVIIQSGLIGTDFTTIYFDKVNTFNVRVNLVDKFFQTGSIGIDTGKIGTSGGRDATIETVLDYISNINAPYETYQKFETTLRTYKESLYK